MAVTSDSSATIGGAPPPGPATGRARADRLGLLKRFLTLREGSIIVVTLVTVIYFSSSTTNFLTGANFKTLLPYFAPFAIMAGGEGVGVSPGRSGPSPRAVGPFLSPLEI